MFIRFQTSDNKHHTYFQVYNWADQSPFMYQNLKDLGSLDMSLLHNNRFIKSYHMIANYDLTYIQNIQRKLDYLEAINITGKEPDYTHSNLCGFAVHVNFVPVSWIMISCNDVLMPNYFLCENKVIPSSTKKRPHLFKRTSYYCGKMFTYIRGSCFKATNNQVQAELQYISFNDSAISSYLSVWALGNYKRKYIVFKLRHSVRECFATNAFPYQRIKMWHRVNYPPCQTTSYTLNVRRLQSYKQACNNHHHHECSESTCILTSYVCDGNHDCGNGSDEISCKSTCDNSADCSGQCLNKNSMCNKLKYQCLSGEHIAFTHVCDWKAHCSDNSDESRCNVVSDIYSNSLDLLTIETNAPKVSKRLGS